MKAQNLVVDTAALIKHVRLDRLSSHLYTVDDVLKEVRDAHARQFLDTLPFTIQVAEPAPEDIKTVIAFSRKTGDYPSLSRVDLQVLALTLTLERERRGTEHLRKDPLVPQLVRGTLFEDSLMTFLFSISAPMVGRVGWPKKRQRKARRKQVKAQRNPSRISANKQEQRQATRVRSTVMIPMKKAKQQIVLLTLARI